MIDFVKLTYLKRETTLITLRTMICDFIQMLDVKRQKSRYPYRSDDKRTAEFSYAEISKVNVPEEIIDAAYSGVIWTPIPELTGQ